jgi:orotate phosphoribosyltransferase
MSYSNLIPEMKRIGAVSCWDTGAFKEGLFKLKSENMSPVYISADLVLKDVTYRDIATSAMASLAADLEFDVVAGGELRGVSFADFLAQRINKPSVAVRKKPKTYGARTGEMKEYWIEGMIPEDFEGKKALLSEDLITDGGSKIVFINGIRNSGGKVRDCIVYVDRQQGGKERLEKEGVKLYSVTDLDTILMVGKERGFLKEEDFKGIEDYRADEKKWNLDRGYEWHE